MDQYQEDLDFNYATETELDNHEAFIMGKHNPDVCWICTSRDVWHKNPFYKGPEVQHPEAFDDSEY
jgi:hypothetical protein